MDIKLGGSIEGIFRLTLFMTEKEWIDNNRLDDNVVYEQIGMLEKFAKENGMDLNLLIDEDFKE